MPKYIDADRLIKTINGRSTHLLNEWDTLGVLAAIDEQPAADVQEVKHGKWKYTGTVRDGIDEYDYYRCSVCIIPEYEKHRFCPNCGAKMDLEESE